MSRLEVLATDKEYQKRIIWISITKQGVYSDWIRGQTDNHMSYHGDGTIWLTREGETRQIMKGSPLNPLNNFKGSYQLYLSSFSCDINKIRTTLEYEKKKLDSVVYIDTRTYKSKKFVSISPFLLEPKRFDLLKGIQPSSTEIHIFTHFNPWVIIYVS